MSKKIKNLMKISVIIPTHNRPELLKEAIQSVIVQSCSNWEIIVVDDASIPPANISEYKKQYGSKIKLIRNEVQSNLAIAREQGVKSSSGELIMQLDDDDLLEPDALLHAHDSLKQHPDFDIVFINVKGFGEKSKVFDSNQFQALDKILRNYTINEVSPETIELDDKLFSYLLNSVPMAFQRSMLYKKAWQDISEFRIKTYLEDPEIPTREMAIQRISPPLRDSEWALYAALLKRIIFLNKKKYLQRCNLQGYYSVESNKKRAQNSIIDIKKHLYIGSKKNKIMSFWKKEIKDNYADMFFDIAFEFFNEGKRFKAYKMVLRAIYITPKLKYFNFFIRLSLNVIR